MSLYTMPCVIFSGGKSSRMGEDKAFLPFGNSNSLVEYQIHRLEDIFEDVYVSAKDNNKFENIDTMLIEDILHKEVYAPTAGFINVFKKLQDEEAFFVLSVDTPFVNKDIISQLVEASAKNYDAVIVRTASGIHPLCGIYTRALEKAIKMMLKTGEHKLKKLLENSNVYYVEVEDEELMLNLNTPEQYKKALSLLTT